MQNFILIAALIMIMMGMRVPSALGKFNIYINRVVNYLQAVDPVTNISNGIRLGLLSAEMTNLGNLLTSWIALYALHIDPNTKTKNTRSLVVAFIKSFRLLFRPLLIRMDGSPNCTDADRNGLNIKVKKPYGRKHTQIKDHVFNDEKQLGGGDIEITCRTETDAKNASIHPDATGWQIAYDIVDTKMGSSETQGKVRITYTEAPDDCLNFELRTKAKDVVKLGAENKGRELVYWLRWYDLRNPALSSPWSSRRIITIL